MKAQKWDGILSFHPYFDIRHCCQLYGPAELYPQENSVR